MTFTSSFSTSFLREAIQKRGKKYLKVQATLPHESGIFEQGDFLAISDIYFQGVGKSLPAFDDGGAAFKIAESLRKTGLYEASAEACETLLSIHKGGQQENSITAMLAKIDAARGKYEDAERRLEGLLKRGIEDTRLLADVKLTLADLYYQRNQFEKAVPLYGDILQKAAVHEGIDVVQRNYGRYLLAGNMIPAARTTYLRAIQDYGAHPERYRADVLADIYMGLGDAYLSERKVRRRHCNVSQGPVRRFRQGREKMAYFPVGESVCRARMIFRGRKKTFAQLRDAAEENFGPKLADYYLIGRVCPEENRRFKMNDLEFLQQSFDNFNKATTSLQQAYANLEQKFESINRELEIKNLELEATIAAKEDMKNYLQNILESLTNGVIVTDLAGKHRDGQSLCRTYLPR